MWQSVCGGRKSSKSGDTKSCGCYSIERLTGKNNHEYRHDLSKKERDEHKNRRYCPKNWAWRRRVFVRDDYTCQNCGCRGKSIAAHHIYSYHSHKKLRYTTSNGVTLCVKCHRKFHKEYGYKFNTRKQFNKFKKTQQHAHYKT